MANCSAIFILAFLLTPPPGRKDILGSAVKLMRDSYHLFMCYNTNKPRYGLVSSMLFFSFVLLHIPECIHTHTARLYALLEDTTTAATEREKLMNCKSGDIEGRHQKKSVIAN